MMVNGIYRSKNFLNSIIILLVFLLYGNTIPNGYSLDDTYVVQNNPRVEKGISGIPEIFTSRYVDEEGNSFGYRPVAMATFAIEYSLWGQNPHLSHFINILLLAITLILLMKVLSKIFRDTHVFFLFTVMLLFVAHPLHTEVVASLKNRESLLSFMFSMMALIFFMKWLESRRIWALLTGISFFIIAFLSKQDAITFVAVIPLALFYHHKGSLALAVSKGNLVNSFKKHFSITFIGLDIYAVIAIIGFVLFVVFYYLIFNSLMIKISFLSSLIFMFIHYKKWRISNPQSKRSNVIRNCFLLLAIMLNLILIMNYINPAILFRKYFTLLCLLFYAIFFFRFIPQIGFSLLFEHLKAPKLSIPPIWYYIFVTIILLGVFGMFWYKFPGSYLPAETKTVYNFENPQFVNAQGYSTWPLAFYTLFFYLKKLIWPDPLGFYYGYKMIPEVSWMTPEVIISLLFHVGILLFALWKLPKKHILSFAILYYLITISIFTNIVIKIPGIVGERLAFFPSLGFCIALAWGIFKLLKIPVYANKISKNKLILLLITVLIVIIPYSIKTIKRNRDWKDYFTLYSHDIKYLNNSAKANNVYASQLLKEAFNNDVKNPGPAVQQEYLRLAVNHLKRTLEIDPIYKFAWNNLGFINNYYLGNTKEGITCLEKAVKLDSNYAEAHYNLGAAYKQQQQYDEAVYQYKQAIRSKPDNGIYYSELADAYFRKGEPGKSLEYYKLAAARQPELDLPFIGMGNIYWLSGDTISAINSWDLAFDRNPENSQLAFTLWKYFSERKSLNAKKYEEKAKEFRILDQ